MTQTRASARSIAVGFEVAPLVLLLASTIFAGCAKQQPTPETCKAAIIHMMEIQLDSPGFGNAVAQGAPDLAADDLEESRHWLKSQIPSLIKPEFVAQCVERMARSDVDCTMSATTTDELVGKCRWKVVAGPKGSALGF